MTELPIDTGPDGAQPALRRSGFFHFDVIVSLCAILISAVSLYTGIDNARVQHRLLAASAWPFVGLVLSNGYKGTTDIAIGASNDGVGPAKIRTLEMFYAGRPLRSGVELLQVCCGLSRDPAVMGRQLAHGFSSSIIDESVLRPGDENVVLRFHRSNTDPAIIRRLSHRLTRLGFRICYCSVLDECRIGDLWTTHEVPVATCPPARVPFHPETGQIPPA